MTGFGSASGIVGTSRVAVEVRSVNHRFFNPTLKLPASLARSESELREKLRQRIARGHVTLLVRVDRERERVTAIDEVLFAAYADQLRKLAAQHELGKLDPGDVLRIPGVVASAADEDVELDPQGVQEIVEAAVDALELMRATEGEQLRTYILDRLTIFDAGLARITQRAPLRLQAQRDRLRESVRQLAAGIAVDDQRIAQELAILADRLDIAEELGRLSSHLTGVRGALAQTEGEAVGKRLGFLLQEILREVNTIGSKAADAEIQQDVVLLKEELERLREQVENVE